VFGENEENHKISHSEFPDPGPFLNAELSEWEGLTSSQHEHKLQWQDGHVKYVSLLGAQLSIRFYTLELGSILRRLSCLPLPITVEILKRRVTWERMDMQAAREEINYVRIAVYTADVECWVAEFSSPSVIVATGAWNSWLAAACLLIPTRRLISYILRGSTRPQKVAPLMYVYIYVCESGPNVRKEF
jgi:hypothetical protein